MVCFHRLTAMHETQNPSEAIPWGFDSPSRHHLKYQYPLWNHRLAALVSALCFACFRVGPALRYEFRYSAHPLSFQYLGSARGGLYFLLIILIYARLRNAQRTWYSV